MLKHEIILDSNCRQRALSCNQESMHRRTRCLESISIFLNFYEEAVMAALAPTQKAGQDAQPYVLHS
jgi:hypothetical protein